MQFTFDKKDPASFPFVSTIVSALIERVSSNGETEILLQKRDNCHDSVYHGTWEIPAGHIDKFENAYDTLRREVKEETGLEVTEFLDDEQTEISSNGDDAAFAFKPFLCQQYLKGKGWSWIGFSFRCRAAGEIKAQTDETSGHRWISLESLKTEITQDPKQFFTLHIPVLKQLIAYHEKEKR